MQDPARWVAAEEAMIIATLLLQKAARNSLESGFKQAVWPLVVDAVSQAPSVDIKKNLQQCKTCYDRVCVWFSLVCKQQLITSSSRLSTRLCGPCAACLGLAGMKGSRS